MQVTTDELFREFVNFVKENPIDEVYKQYGGSSLYIPSYKSICRDRDIKEDFKALMDEGKKVSTAVRELRRKYDLSDTAIYSITKELREPSLFDE